MHSQLIPIKNLLDLFLFLNKILENTKNILPPSKGPNGNKLNKPTPKLITTNQNINKLNHLTILEISPYFSLTTSFIFLFNAKSLIPIKPFVTFSGSLVVIILKTPLSVSIVNFCPGFIPLTESKKLCWGASGGTGRSIGSERY